MAETKQSNPKDSLGIRKVPLHAVPTKPLFELGLAMMEGGRKYGSHNYRSIGVRMSTYYDAAQRHLTAWWEGEDIDPDSGIHHIIKAMASLLVVRDSMHMGNCMDDRPLRYPDGINMKKFNKMAADIIEKYPGCVEPFLEIQRVVDEPADDEFFWNMTDDGMMNCDHCSCLRRGFPKKETLNYYCPEHKESKDE